MLNLLLRAGYFISIIILGFILKKVGLFKDSDFSVLSNIVLKITLPAAIVVNFANMQIDFSMLAIAFLGFFGGAVYVCVALLINTKSSKEQRAFDVLNLPGYNIGVFALPFIQGFLGPIGVVSTSLFDVGNAFICLGGSFGIASAIKNGSSFSFNRIVKALLRSVPFITYIFMMILCLARIPFPVQIVDFAQIIANANAFLAMLMIGVGFKLTADRKQIRRIVKIVSLRYGIAAVLAAVFYFLLPFSAEIRNTLVILAFSPIGAAVPPFTKELNSDYGLSSAINSICIIYIYIFIFNISVY